MRHEKHIKRETGVTVSIVVEFNCSLFRDDPHWSHSVATRQPRAKTWYVNSDAATPEEVQETKLELWQKLKP